MPNVHSSIFITQFPICERRFLLVYCSTDYTEYLKMRELRSHRPQAGHMPTPLTDKQYTKMKTTIIPSIVCHLDDIATLQIHHYADVPQEIQSKMKAAAALIPGYYYIGDFRTLRERQEVVADVISMYAMFLAHTDLQFTWS
jgi:hypothetical protein